MREEPVDPAGLPSAVRGVNGLAMLDNFGRGRAASSHLDDERTHAFQVIFQSNDDGRTRALLHTYQVVDASTVGGSSHQVIANSLSVDAGGQLKPTPLTFRPTTQPLIKPVPAG